MPKVLLFILFLSASIKTFSQASDFITVKKKNNRTVKTFFPGLHISFETNEKRQVDGLITAIRNDSIFVREWDIRPMLNSLGIPVTDTLGSYLNGFHYTELAKVDVSDRMKMQAVTPGRILIIGGIGYILLNLINGAYLHEPINSPDNLKRLGIAAAAVGTGILLNNIARHGNKYHVEYVHMNDVKKQLRGF